MNGRPTKQKRRYMLQLLDWWDITSVIIIAFDGWMGITRICTVVSKSVWGIRKGSGGNARFASFVLFNGVVDVE